MRKLNGGICIGYRPAAHRAPGTGPSSTKNGRAAPDPPVLGLRPARRRPPPNRGLGLRAESGMVAVNHRRWRRPARAQGVVRRAPAATSRSWFRMRLRATPAASSAMPSALQPSGRSAPRARHAQPVLPSCSVSSGCSSSWTGGAGSRVSTAVARTLLCAGADGSGQSSSTWSSVPDASNTATSTQLPESTGSGSQTCALRGRVRRETERPSASTGRPRAPRLRRTCTHRRSAARGTALRTRKCARRARDRAAPTPGSARRRYPAHRRGEGPLRVRSKPAAGPARGRHPASAAARRRPTSSYTLPLIQLEGRALRRRAARPRAGCEIACPARMQSACRVRCLAKREQPWRPAPTAVAATAANSARPRRRAPRSISNRR